MVVNLLGAFGVFGLTVCHFHNSQVPVHIQYMDLKHLSNHIFYDILSQEASLANSVILNSVSIHVLNYNIIYQSILTISILKFRMFTLFTVVFINYSRST